MQEYPVISFTFAEKVVVRCVLIDGKPWAVVADVCAALNLGNPSSVVRLLDDEEKGIKVIDTPGGPQKHLCVSEAGLYSIMLRSNAAMKPGTLAYKFRKWVTKDVLETIRESGQYLVPYDPFSPKGSVGTYLGPNGEEPFAIEWPLKDPEREAFAQERAKVMKYPVELMRPLVEREFESAAREGVRRKLTRS